MKNLHLSEYITPMITICARKAMTCSQRPIFPSNITKVGSLRFSMTGTCRLISVIVGLSAHLLVGVGYDNVIHPFWFAFTLGFLIARITCNMCDHHCETTTKWTQFLKMCDPNMFYQIQWWTSVILIISTIIIMTLHVICQTKDLWNYDLWKSDTLVYSLK